MKPDVRLKGEPPASWKGVFIVLVRSGAGSFTPRLASASLKIETICVPANPIFSSGTPDAILPESSIYHMSLERGSLQCPPLVFCKEVLDVLYNPHLGACAAKKQIPISR